MEDLLVRLLDLPDITELEQNLKAEEIVVRRPISAESSIISEWVGAHFGVYWQNEINVAMNHVPARCFVAQRAGLIIGFACYEVTGLNFFGPTGVLENERGKGVGKVLLVKALEAMYDMGYTYAIIGGVGPVEYYKKIVSAQNIDGSEKSIYENMLKNKSRD